jgi:hypothetical protein
MHEIKVVPSFWPYDESLQRAIMCTSEVRLYCLKIAIKDDLVQLLDEADFQLQKEDCSSWWNQHLMVIIKQ